MVHYDPTQQATPKPPRLCPKCGSHRTEIVGTSGDGTVLILRCNACGARSEVASPGPGDDLAAEADAMARIARVLSDLDDLASRERVLRWAIERTSGDAPADTEAFEAAAEVEPPQADDLFGPRVDSASDPKLGVDGISDLFDGSLTGRPAEASAVGGFVIGGDFRRRLRGGWTQA